MSLSQRLLKVSSTVPKDIIRPHIQLSTFLQSLAQHPRLTKSAVQNMEVLSRGELAKKVR